MVRKLLPVILLILILISGTNCIPEHKGPGPTLIGKLVVDTFCLNYVISVVQGNIGAYPVIPEWKNTDNDSIYINAFAVSNHCTFGQFGLKKGDIFSFEMDSMPPAQPCMVCQIYYPVPAYSHAVRNVRKIN